MGYPESTQYAQHSAGSCVFSSSKNISEMNMEDIFKGCTTRMGRSAFHCGEQEATRGLYTVEPLGHQQSHDCTEQVLPRWTYDVVACFQLRDSPQHTPRTDRSPPTRTPASQHRKLKLQQAQKPSLAHLEAFMFTLFSTTTAISDISLLFFPFSKRKSLNNVYSQTTKTTKQEKGANLKSLCFMLMNSKHWKSGTIWKL